MKLPDLPEKFDDVQRAVLAQFRLDVLGTHGLPHWRRVWRNGKLIGALDRKVDMDVLALFAMLHDSQRENEWEDIGHGARAARFVMLLRNEGKLDFLTEEQYTWLKAACCDHERGYNLLPERDDRGAHTLQACWDADRLDLPRVGVMPDPARMRSEYALLPGVIEAHWEEAWNYPYPEAAELYVATAEL